MLVCFEKHLHIFIFSLLGSTFTLKHLPMKKYLFAALFLCQSLFSNAQPPAGNAEPGDHYGAKVKPAGAIALADIANELENKTILSDIKIKAKILDVCPNKGCWLKLELPNGNQATVKMKDYGFFVPLAAKGKTVVIDGNAALKTTPVSELKHFAEDAKKSKAEIDAITTPKKEVTILASGIVVVE